MLVDDRHDVRTRRLADRQGAEDPFAHRAAPFRHLPFGTVLITESKKPNSASPPMKPAASTSMPPVALSPFHLSTATRIAMPANTAHPAIGFGISRPVANRMPSWRDGPPINCSTAP